MTVPSSPLVLRDVTLCAVTSTNLHATISALEHCRARVEFGDTILLTDAMMAPLTGIRVVPIERLETSAAYSRFMLADLADHIATSHCLVVQWDGHLLNAGHWDPAFLAYDYIGAVWPQFDDGRDVGNGGFSLRSRRLLEACSAPGFVPAHPEDTSICRDNRDFLESRGLVFADAVLADRFACERQGNPAHAFGFHGVFNMITAMGPDRFWDNYRTLDDRTSIWRDFGRIMRDLGEGSDALRRRLRFTFDWLLEFAGMKRRP